MARTTRTAVFSAMFLASTFFCAPVWAQQLDPATAAAIQQLATSAAAIAGHFAQQPAQPAAPATGASVPMTGDCGQIADAASQALCVSQQALSRTNAAHGRLDSLEPRVKKLETRLGNVVHVPAQPASTGVRQASAAASQKGGVPATLAAVPGAPAPTAPKRDHAVVIRFSGEIPRTEDVALVLQRKTEGYTVEQVVWLPPGVDQTTREVARRNDPAWAKRDAALDAAAGMNFAGRIATDAETKDAARLPAGTLAYAIMRAPRTTAATPYP